LIDLTLVHADHQLALFAELLELDLAVAREQN
jgi:hypothetical protein